MAINIYSVLRRTTIRQNQNGKFIHLLEKHKETNV